jgi:hypothetical protein
VQGGKRCQPWRPALASAARAECGVFRRWSFVGAEAEAEVIAEARAPHVEVAIVFGAPIEVGDTLVIVDAFQRRLRIVHHKEDDFVVADAAGDSGFDFGHLCHVHLSSLGLLGLARWLVVSPLLHRRQQDLPRQHIRYLHGLTQQGELDQAIFLSVHLKLDHLNAALMQQDPHAAGPLAVDAVDAADGLGQHSRSPLQAGDDEPGALRERVGRGTLGTHEHDPWSARLEVVGLPCGVVHRAVDARRGDGAVVQPTLDLVGLLDARRDDDELLLGLGVQQLQDAGDLGRVVGQDAGGTREPARGRGGADVAQVADLSGRASPSVVALDDGWI